MRTQRPVGETAERVFLCAKAPTTWPVCDNRQKNKTHQRHIISLVAVSASRLQVSHGAQLHFLWRITTAAVSWCGVGPAGVGSSPTSGSHAAQPSVQITGSAGTAFGRRSLCESNIRIADQDL